ncbi:MAG: hypothetical protein ACRDHL_08075, partial [Candidatus Promineifilaceae bacterium]
VEYYKSKGLGPLRESLIGSAPLITGTLVVLFISFRVFDVNVLASAFATGSVDALTVGLTELLATADFLVWLYLIFAISNAMMPSSSDRRAWPLFALLLAAAAGVVYLLDLDLVLIEPLGAPARAIFGYLGLAFSLAIGVDLFFMLLIGLVEWAASRLKGVDLVYGQAAPPDSGRQASL